MPDLMAAEREEAYDTAPLRYQLAWWSRGNWDYEEIIRALDALEAAERRLKEAREMLEELRAGVAGYLGNSHMTEPEDGIRNAEAFDAAMRRAAEWLKAAKEE